MAYCTLDEAWGSNFFNESLKDINIQNNFLETVKTPNMTRSYNNQPNTNGPNSRYIDNTNNNNIRFNSKEIKQPNEQVQTHPTTSKAPLQGTISNDDKLKYSLENRNMKKENKKKETHFKKIKHDNDNLNKLVLSYKKYFKKSKKILNSFTMKLDILKKIPKFI